MRLLLVVATLLAFASVESAYSKYGRTCADIGCLNNEECVMEEDACTLQSKGHCGTFPSCKRVKPKGKTCDNYVCPDTQVCQVKNNQPRCVNKEILLAPRRKRQSYNPSYSTTDMPKYSVSQPKYPDLHDSTPSAPTRQHRVTTERPNTYQIGYTQSAGNPSQRQPTAHIPNQPGGYPTQGSSNRGYPSQSYPNQGYPSQGYPAQNYPTQGYPNQAYPNQGYPNQGYPNQGYPSQNYPSQGQGYPNQGYPNQGYPSQGYPNQAYPSQGYPNQGYPNQGYPNQGPPNQGYPNQGYPNQGYPNQAYPGQQGAGYQYPGYQNQGYGGQQRPQGANQPGFLDPILNTLSKTVTQIGANYLRDKIFSGNVKQTPTQ